MEKIIKNKHRDLTAAIFDVVDAMIYVADMETHELLYLNQYGRRNWGEPGGRPCWKVLQSGQTGPCEFCTNDKLLDKDGRPTGVHVWEFQNTVDGRWYQCRDQAIKWIDGRIARLEIATDITARKLAESELKQATIKSEALARIDALTGVKNRRAIFEAGEQILNMARRFNHPAAVMILDIDNFKHINDKHGHITGDRVLASFARLIEKSVREVDPFGRIGGDEFVLILPETDLMAAVDVAEKLRNKISAMAVNEGNEIIHITSSLGIATNVAGIESFENILLEADKALYRAKETGRNRVGY